MRRQRVYLETTMFNHYLDKHINKVKTKRETGIINEREGYRPVAILNPMEV